MYKRELFTLEQQEILDAVIRNKHWNAITSVFPIQTPGQEYEISKILKEYAPTFKPSVLSKVEEELKIELSKNPQLFDNPEVEAAWQAKLDAEKKEREAEAKEEEVTEAPTEVAPPTPKPPKAKKTKK